MNHSPRCNQPHEHAAVQRGQRPSDVEWLPSHPAPAYEDALLEPQ